MRYRLLTAAGALLVALVSLTTPAEAVTGGAGGDSADPGAELTATAPSSTTTYFVTEAPFGVATKSTATAPVATAYNPGGCTTYADNPHPSGHVPGTINATVRQVCGVVVQNNSTEAKLWEKRWWGYDVIGGPNFSPLTTSKTSSVNVSAGCRSNYIRVTGYGHYLWAGQHIRSAEVFNTKYVSC